jgi:hypothetical protein
MQRHQWICKIRLSYLNRRHLDVELGNTFGYKHQVVYVLRIFLKQNTKEMHSNILEALEQIN